MTDRASGVTPYYDEDGITIYHGDCRDVLPQITDVGLVLTSPPYNLNGDGYRPHGNTHSRLDDGYDTHGDNMPHVEYVAWQREVLTACWATSADDGAIFYNHKPILQNNRARLPFELVPPGLPLRQVVTWDRTSGFMRVFNYFCPSYEWILVLAKDAFKLTTRSVFDVWRIPSVPDPEHPASFPLRLASRAVNSTRAQVVLDPFMGSGTTLRAAKDAGRRAIGIEKSERYCEVAVSRLAQGVLAL